MTQRIGYGAILVIIFCVGLGNHDLAAPDEPRFALVAQEMIRDGNWLFPHRNERPYPDKPPLFFWSIAASSLLQGGEINAFSARFPSAVAALAVCAMLFAFERRERAVKWPLSPLILASSLKFAQQSHLAQIDMMLCALTTWAFIEGFRILKGERHSAWRMGVAMGFGILAKGPVALILPLGACAVYAWWAGAGWKKFPWRAVAWSLVPPAIWLTGLGIQVWMSDQWDYFTNLLFDQTVVRYFNAWHHHKPVTYFLQTILHDFFPWSPWLLAALPMTKLRRANLQDAERFAWCVVVFTLLFFSASKGKRNLYILPLFPFAAYAVAAFMARLNREKWARWVAVVPAVIWLLVSVALVLLVTSDMIDVTNFGARGVVPWGLAVGGGLMVVITLVSMVQGSRARWRDYQVGMIANTFCLVVVAYAIGVPWVDQFRSERPFVEAIHQAVRQEGTADAQLGMVDFRSAFRFFGDRYVHELATREPTKSNPKLIGLPDLNAFTAANEDAWVVIRQADLDDYQGQIARDFEVRLADPNDGRNRYRLLHFKAPRLDSQEPDADKHPFSDTESQ